MSLPFIILAVVLAAGLLAAIMVAYEFQWRSFR